MKIENKFKLVQLLKHPYPFKCSFTICNDCDYVTRDAFETIHQFINTTDNTKLGKGLGLPIADSMFMYCERPGVLSYFEGISGRPGRDSGFLRDAIREGWIDSLHAYGDFINTNAFSRNLAKTALSELEKSNIKLKVWIDHGSSDNSQNLNIPKILLKGDSPKSKAYHTDLLKNYGISFVAGYNSDLIGQNARRKYISKPLQQPEVPFSLPKRVHGRFYGTRLLRKAKYRDSSIFYFFCRARNGVLRPDASTLSHQLSQENVERLIQSEGTMVLYQHLGAINRSENTFPYLDPKAVRALENIAKGFSNQSIWVAPTSKLLRYALVRNNLTLRCENRNDELVIEMIKLSDELEELEREDLENISFRVQNCGGHKIVLKYGSYRFKKEEYEVFEDDGIVVKISPAVLK
jgi:hypothetical protein